MSYAIELDGSVIDALATHSDIVRNGVEAHLLRLAEDPVNLSAKSGFPHPATGQRFSFDVLDLEHVRHYFAVWFHYTLDEKMIQVFALTHTNY